MRAAPMRWDEAWLNADRVTAYPPLFLLIYAVVGTAWCLLSTDLVDPLGKPLGYDFITFWAASRLALEGRATAVFDPASIFLAERVAVPASDSVFLWHYPPTFHLLVLPLALLPYLWSYLAWVGATGALYLATLRQAFGRQATWLLLAFPGAFVNLFHGQNAFLSTALMAAACLRLERRPVLAGIAIGLLAYKPHLGLLLPLALIAGGHWRAFAAAAATTLAFCGTATAVFGTAGWLAFWNNLPLTRHVLEAGLLPWHKMPSVFAALRLLGCGIPAAHALHAMVAAAVAVLVVLAWRRRDTPLGPRAALLSVGTLLLSPYGFDYDLVILALPIGLLARDGLENGWMPGMRTALVAAWLAPAVLPVLAEWTGLQLMPLVLLGLFAVAWTRLNAATDRGTSRAVVPAA